MNKGGEAGLKKGRKYYRMCGICGKKKRTKRNEKDSI